LRKYETIFILKPDLPREVAIETLDKMKTILDAQKVQLISMDVWGKKKLAYEVKKFPKGIFILATYLAMPAVIKEFERNLKINQEVLKYLTVQLDDSVDVEKEMAAAKPYDKATLFPPEESFEKPEEEDLRPKRIDDDDDEESDFNDDPRGGGDDYDDSPRVSGDRSGSSKDDSDED
jgi:small subunit ribosomal protein S6